MRICAPILIATCVLAGCGGGGQSAETDRNALPGPVSVDYAPTWSPDGRSIAFLAGGQVGETGAIAMIDVDGTHVTRIGKDLGRLGVDKIAFSPTRNELLVVTSDGELPGFETREVQILSLEGELRSVSRSSRDDADPVWSHDGDWIAFSSDRAGNDDVYVVRRDGKSLRRLTRTKTQEGWPAWSPDRRRLIVRQSRDATESLLLIDVASGRTRTLARFHPSDNLNAAGWHAEWTADGRRIVTDIGAVITILDVASGKRRVLPLFATNARLSPDGRRALVDAYRKVKPPCPYICVAEDALTAVRVRDGRTFALLRAPPRYAIDAAWSPDGRRLALVLVTGETSAERGLFVADADGTNLRALIR